MGEGTPPLTLPYFGALLVGQLGGRLLVVKIQDERESEQGPWEAVTDADR